MAYVRTECIMTQRLHDLRHEEERQLNGVLLEDAMRIL